MDPNLLKPLVNGVIQKQLVIGNPIQFMLIVLNTIAYEYEYLFKQMVGILGWVDYSYNTIIYILYLLIFAYVIKESATSNKKIIPRFIYVVLILILTATILFIFLALYIMWTPVGYSQVLGIQGRYFLPLLPFFILLVHQTLVRLKNRGKIIIFGSISLFITAQTFISVLSRYYKTNQTNNNNEFVSYMSSLIDPTKLKYMPIDKPVAFLISKKDKDSISGFRFYFITLQKSITTQYRYSLMDKACKKNYAKGNLDMNRLQQDAVYKELFDKVDIAGDKVCFLLGPNEKSIKENYLNIIVADNKPLIELIY